MAKAPKVKLTYLDDTEAECLFTARVQVAIERHFGKKLTDILDSAEAVYFGKRVPAVQGAMFYHANYIKPDWARDKTIVARIGRHVFYR